MPAAQQTRLLSCNWSWAALLLCTSTPHAPRRLYASCKRFSRFFASSEFTGLLTSLGPTPSSSSSEPLPLGLSGGASPSFCSMSLALSPGTAPRLSRLLPGAAGTAAEAAGQSCRSASSPSTPASACGALRSRFAARVIAAYVVRHHTRPCSEKAATAAHYLYFSWTINKEKGSLNRLAAYMLGMIEVSHLIPWRIHRRRTVPGVTARVMDAVIGAGGPTGLECVKRLAQLGRPVRAVVRNPDKYKDAFQNLGSTVSVVKGDVEAPASLREALAGVQNIIFAASGKGYFSARAVDELVRPSVVSHTCAAHTMFFFWGVNKLRSALMQGVGAVADIAKASGAKRVVLISSALVSPHNRYARLFGCSWSVLPIKKSRALGSLHSVFLVVCNTASCTLARLLGQLSVACS